MGLSSATTNVTQSRETLRAATYLDEAISVSELLTLDTRTLPLTNESQKLARKLIRGCRDNRADRSLLDAFLEQFGLSTQEGVALMCLAESVLRIPDSATVDALISDKLSGKRWSEHIGRSDMLLVNASTWALMLTGRVVELGEPIEGDFSGWLGQLISRTGEPVIRRSLKVAMQLLGNEFVFARTPEQAMEKSRPGTVYSFDMLGEAARTEADAKSYFESYLHALAVLARTGPFSDSITASGISVKLSALHCRYESRQRKSVEKILYPRLLELAERAAAVNVQLTIDAEEANRLDVSLDLIERLSREPHLNSWRGLGIALQAYSKRAVPLIDWLSTLSDETGRRFIVRLVKGAYWDTEIKHAQVLGVATYPVYTTKAATDLAYLVCAQKLLARPDAFFPQFATHNAHTLASVLKLAKSPIELQRLHGMGELLYAQAAEQLDALPQVRVYAPIGPHKHLLAYLIRRLLENGANSSFVNRFLDAQTSVDDLVIDPRRSIETALKSKRQTPIPTPPNLYLPERANSPGVDIEDPHHLETIVSAMAPFANYQWGENADGGSTIVNPGRNDDIVGHYRPAQPADIEAALVACVQAQPAWNALGGGERAAMLRRIASGFEKHQGELMALLVREAGKTLDEALSEIREAWDFCHYYAHQAELHFQSPLKLPGPTGESNLLNLQGRGTFLCISPWNFPLAIFTGQVCAALAAGNSVVAKPSEQTTLVAMRVVTLMYAAGVPGSVLHLLTGEGAVVGRALAEDERVSGVAFTGSTATAKLLQRTLAARSGAIVPLIAETGGQNAMIVDSTAMIEQVVDDAIASAFGAAGQRCSALRVLHLQHDIADEVLTMLQGAMDALVIGDPWSPDTDIGPIIDKRALARLQHHADGLAARCLHKAALPDGLNGHYMAPQLFELNSITELAEENFGPLLHVVRYSRDRLDNVLAELNATGYGLTLGIHSRNNQFIDRVYTRSNAGNVYVNRNMIGAVVGVQPFGGQGLSGTGPKAGGPNYLQRFASERTLTNNVAAIGGNLDLLTK